jgi:hypothetical protein
LGRSSHAPYFCWYLTRGLGSGLPSELCSSRELLVLEIEVEPSAYIIVVSTPTRSITFQNSHPLPPRLPLEDGNSSKPRLTFVRNMTLCMLCKNMSTADRSESRLGDNLPPEGYSRFSFCTRTNRSDSRKLQSITRVGLAEAKQDAHGWDYRKASLEYSRLRALHSHT